MFLGNLIFETISPFAEEEDLLLNVFNNVTTLQLRGFCYPQRDDEEEDELRSTYSLNGMGWDSITWPIRVWHCRVGLVVLVGQDTR